jgi:tetratricopeptide (TPR) repeat protein
MRFAGAIVCLLLVLPARAEQPQRCGGGRTVDDYLADIAKSQKKQRSKNPLPDSVCVWGWCKHKAPKGPFPDPPSVDPKSSPDQKPEQKPVQPPPGESSSKRPVEEVAAPPKLDETDDSCDPIRAAKDIEVGDFYYTQSSYKPALMRYKLALEGWPGEPNILFRLAKTYERMKDTDHAMQSYQQVIAADPEAPIAKEAQAALTRLKK